MNAKILRIPTPARKRRESVSDDTVAVILATLQRIERRIERLERVARPTEFWEWEDETHE